MNLKGPAKLPSLGRCLEKAVGGKLNENAQIVYWKTRRIHLYLKQ